MEATGRILRTTEAQLADDPSALRARATRRFTEGRLRSRSAPAEAEALCRGALLDLRDAYLLTKDLVLLKLLHRYGRAVHKLFSCEIEFSRGFYRQTCPVALSHIKHGLSPAIIAEQECSICGLNMLDCPHARGSLYDGVPARKSVGVCNICLRSECDHVVGKPYDGVTAIALMKNIQAEHIAIVENPKDPLAAIMSVSLEPAEVEANAPRSFQYGSSPLFCEHCRTCRGESAAA